MVVIVGVKVNQRLLVVPRRCYPIVLCLYLGQQTRTFYLTIARSVVPKIKFHIICNTHYSQCPRDKLHFVFIIPTVDTGFFSFSVFVVFVILL